MRKRHQLVACAVLSAFVAAPLLLTGRAQSPITNSAAISVVDVHQNADMTIDVTFAIAVTMTDNFNAVAWKVQESTNFQADWFDPGGTNILNIWITPAGAGTVSMTATETVHDAISSAGQFYRGVVVRGP